MANGEARIDKWLWAARIFKTRTMAAMACKRGQVTIGGVQLKPSRMVKEGDTVSVRRSPITYSFRVLQAVEKRVGAKLASDVVENVTPSDQYELLELSKVSGFVNRVRGTGRPTKKERRSLDEFAVGVADFLCDEGFDFNDEDTYDET